MYVVFITQQLYHDDNSAAYSVLTTIVVPHRAYNRIKLTDKHKYLHLRCGLTYRDRY